MNRTEQHKNVVEINKRIEDIRKRLSLTTARAGPVWHRHTGESFLTFSTMFNTFLQALDCQHIITIGPVYLNVPNDINEARQLANLAPNQPLPPSWVPSLTVRQGVDPVQYQYEIEVERIQLNFVWFALDHAISNVLEAKGQMSMVPAPNAYIAWAKLLNTYVPHVEYQAVQSMAEFQALRIRQGESFTQFETRFYKALNAVTGSGQSMDERTARNQLVNAIQGALPPHRRDIFNSDYTLTVAAIFAKLRSFEVADQRASQASRRGDNQGQTSRSAAYSVSASSVSSSPSPVKSSDKCNKCGKIGHWARDCKSEAKVKAGKMGGKATAKKKKGDKKASTKKKGGASSKSSSSSSASSDSGKENKGKENKERTLAHTPNVICNWCGKKNHT